MCHITTVTHFKAMIAGHIIVVDLTSAWSLNAVTLFIQGLMQECRGKQVSIDEIELRIKTQYPKSEFINELPYVYSAHTIQDPASS